MTSRNGHRAPVLLAAAALVAAPLVAGCGGADTDKMQSWIGTYCGAANGIRDALSGTNDLVRSQLEIPDLPPSELAGTYPAAADRAIEAAEKAKQRIDDQGAPPVDDGEQIQQAALKGIDETIASLQAFKEQAEAVPTDDPEAFAAALPEVSQALTDENNRIAGSLEALDTYDGTAQLRDTLGSDADITDAEGTCKRFETPAPS